MSINRKYLNFLNTLCAVFATGLLTAIVLAVAAFVAGMTCQVTYALFMFGWNL